METYERAQIESLLATDDEVRRLWEEHLAYERELTRIEGLPHLTPEEELEKKRIQKLKLAGRDQLAQILARHRKQA
jgi:uncharacterized protein YdcH (DUF465 family)